MEMTNNLKHVVKKTLHNLKRFKRIYICFMFFVMNGSKEYLSFGEHYNNKLKFSPNLQRKKYKLQL